MPRPFSFTDAKRLIGEHQDFLSGLSAGAVASDQFRGEIGQAIAAMVSLKNTGGTHFVVVCPASVIENRCREIPRYEKYEIDTLKQLLYLEIISMIQKGTIIWKCRNCNRYFVVSNRKVAYCDRMDNTGKFCSSIDHRDLSKRRWLRRKS